MIKDRFNIILNAAAFKILYISLPKPASDAFPKTKPCLQNCSGGRLRILEAPEKESNIYNPNSNKHLQKVTIFHKPLKMKHSNCFQFLFNTGT